MPCVDMYRRIFHCFNACRASSRPRQLVRGAHKCLLGRRRLLFCPFTCMLQRWRAAWRLHQRVWRAPTHTIATSAGYEHSVLLFRCLHCGVEVSIPAYTCHTLPAVSYSGRQCPASAPVAKRATYPTGSVRTSLAAAGQAT